VRSPESARSPESEGPASRSALDHNANGNVYGYDQGKAEEWVPAPHMDDCILVNLGDALSFWSGTQLKATLHRVTFDNLPFDRERQSMAYFAQASSDTVLQPIVPKPHTTVDTTVGTQAQTQTPAYYSNGVELRPGVTVGELRRMIMANIYGGAFNNARDGEPVPLTATATATATA